ncbi:hypothetical protein FE257_011881 [Aspergillus nanangensis]|uniref:Nucleoside phosphorylase domain-containing protein n=1 Tax=Aspergillus nanangensis TaxID=2582783 RepID=A0AAD4CHC9_ASPNN|nr:hypothetical protein FE257_011881 [Aspergillus nanangensis]
MDIPPPGELGKCGLPHLASRQKTFHTEGLPALQHELYTVAWICALSFEMAAAQAVLDERHEPLPTHTDDTNTYALGNIQGHNVVIACLPMNQYGIVNAATVMTNLKRTFPAIRVGLMVGIGGGVPSMADVRLGDVVVGTRVMQTDLGKIVAGEQLERTSIPKIPHQLLGTAVSALRSKHELGPSQVPSILQLKLEGHGYGRPSLPDRLFLATYHHQATTGSCDECDHSKEPPATKSDEDPSQERRKMLSNSLRFEQADARKSNINRAHGKTCQWLLNHPDYKAWLDPEKLAQHHGFLWITDMVQYFEDLSKQSTANGVPLRVCFSSRHHPYIIIRWGTRLTLEHQPGHAKDLEVYIRGHLRADDPIIIKKLLHKSAGVFMWVVLVIEILNREYARGAMSLNRRLEEIPSDLSELFKDILRRENSNLEELRLCFLWILCAKNHLTPDEFYLALWSGLSSQGLVENEIPDSSVKDASNSLPRAHRYVISSSRGLAEVAGSKVQFIHESVRDFLVKDRGLYELWPELGLDWEGPSHDMLKHCCLVYITQFDFHDFLRWPSMIPNKHRFLEYATTNILYHANAANKAVPQSEFLSTFPITKWIHMNNFFEKSPFLKYTQAANLLYILADKGYPELIRARLKTDPNIHVRGERHRYPLFASLARGNKASFAALLNVSSTIYDGVDVIEGLNYRNDLEEYVYDHTPVSWAMFTGREGIVKLLLQGGMSVNHVDADRDTLLSMAVRIGQGALVMLLLDRGADINARNADGWAPLFHALKWNPKSMTRLLIDRGADVNARDNDRSTPLFTAAEYSCESTTRLLIDRRADVNARDNNGLTPLLAALKYRSESTARLLIDRGAYVNARDN